MKLMFVVMCIGLSATWASAQTSRRTGTIVIVQEWEHAPAGTRSASALTTRSSLVILHTDSLSTTPIRPFHRIYADHPPIPKKNRIAEQEVDPIDVIEETEMAPLFSMIPAVSPVNPAPWKKLRPK